MSRSLFWRLFSVKQKKKPCFLGDEVQKVDNYDSHEAALNSITYSHLLFPTRILKPCFLGRPICLVFFVLPNKEILPEWMK